ncbi:Synaptonemal complex protein 3 [Eumeta japonica]|uniref:Synaptonemal complex protein 3 n=1 Tax=Eumeta variegata TaxID=151549 RepID=A0A4C1ZJB2_EUMVA|nr:Synaptonemal complex protein 3 [Eumeta japonica]
MPKMLKKTIKNKFYADNDFMSEYVPPSIKEDLPVKRKMDKINNDDFNELENKNPKRNKPEISGEIVIEKVLQIMKHQIDSGKQGNQRLMYSLSTLLEQMEGDFITLKENEKRLQQLNLAHLKCVQQANNVNKERIQCLKEILSTFHKQCDEQELNQQNDYKKLETDLAAEIKMLHKKLIEEARRKQMQNVQRSIINAFEIND